MVHKLAMHLHKRGLGSGIALFLSLVLLYDSCIPGEAHSNSWEEGGCPQSQGTQREGLGLRVPDAVSHRRKGSCSYELLSH